MSGPLAAIWQPAGIKVAGIPLGTAAFKREVLLTTLSNAARLTDRLADLAQQAPAGWCRRQSAFSILRLCVLLR